MDGDSSKMSSKSSLSRVTLMLLLALSLEGSQQCIFPRLKRNDIDVLPAQATLIFVYNAQICTTVQSRALIARREQTRASWLFAIPCRATVADLSTAPRFYILASMLSAGHLHDRRRTASESGGTAITHSIRYM